jgi:hypothetical protein
VPDAGKLQFTELGVRSQKLRWAQVLTSFCCKCLLLVITYNTNTHPNLRPEGGLQIFSEVRGSAPWKVVVRMELRALQQMTFSLHNSRQAGPLIDQSAWLRIP